MSLINKTHIKNYILRRREKLRPGWGCTQVAGDVYEKLEARLKNYIDSELGRHPTKGKTFRIM